MTCRELTSHALVHGKGAPLTYTDSDVESWLVRWWQDTFDVPQTSAALYSMDITLRYEVLAW